MSHPVLYSFRRCPFAIRARLAITSSGFVCEIREICLKNKPIQMLNASPKATVPLMVLAEDHVLDESLDIMTYTLRLRDPNDWLAGHNEQGLFLIHRNDHIFKNHLDRYKYRDQYLDDNFDHREACLEILRDLERRLEQNGCLLRSQYSLADNAILPFIRQFAAVDETWFAAQSLPRVQVWLADFLTSSLFKDAMVTFNIWEEGDHAVFFPANASAPTLSPSLAVSAVI